MQQPLNAAGPSRPNEFANTRDARVVWLLGDHPVTAAMLVRIGWFPSNAKARRRLRRLAKRDRVRLVGTVSRHSGRPEHVYCRWRPQVNQLLHEVLLTEVCLRIEAAEVRRGPAATDERLRPDAELRINGRTYFLELDTGSMSHTQIARRFRLYEGSPHLSLWVCPTPGRAEAMRTRAGVLRHTALFTTLAAVLASPHGPVWRDFDGGAASLPREAGRKGG
jgi:hypothetical protein